MTGRAMPLHTMRVLMPAADGCLFRIRLRG